MIRKQIDVSCDICEFHEEAVVHNAHEIDLPKGWVMIEGDKDTGGSFECHICKFCVKKIVGKIKNK